MRIVSWNVNGLRACLGKGFVRWLNRTSPDVVGLQEVRAFPEQVEPLLQRAGAFQRSWFPAERAGYSGVGLLAKAAPVSVERGLGITAFDSEGRLVVAEFEEFSYFNGYFPKGSGRERDNSRVPYKLAFYEAVLQKALAVRARKKGVIVGGDFNTAHQPIDLKNWKANQKTSGFLPNERAMIDRYLAAGFRDVFRDLHPDLEGQYSWWSQMPGARARNVGWRVDYFLVSEDIAPRVSKAWIEPRVTGSDHCPVGIEID